MIHQRKFSHLLSKINDQLHFLNLFYQLKKFEDVEDKKKEKKTEYLSNSNKNAQLLLQFNQKVKMLRKQLVHRRK